VRRIDCCPICDLPYEEGHDKPRRKSKHHIFCRVWYPSSTLTVDVCQKCHDEFNRDYQNKAIRRWSKVECVNSWVTFCYVKGINALRSYPQLIKYMK
jgi:hypothetical protein